MNEPSRPHICTAVECGGLRSFAHLRGLRSHENEVHNLTGNRMKLLCSDLDCERSRVGNGFTRKTSLAQHIENMHKKVQINTGYKKDAQDSEPSLKPLPDIKGHFPRVGSPRLQLSDLLEVPLQPTQTPLPSEGVVITRRKRSRQTEVGDEGGEKLATTEVSSIEVKRLKQVIKDQNGQLIEKDGQLVEAGRQLEEKDRQLVKKDRQVEERDRLLVKKDKQLGEKDGQLVKTGRQLEEKDRLLVKKDRQLREIDRQLVGMDRHLAEKDRHLVGMDRHLAEKDRQLVGMDRKLADKDAQIAMLERLVQRAMTTQRPRS